MKRMRAAGVVAGCRTGGLVLLSLVLVLAGCHLPNGGAPARRTSVPIATNTTGGAGPEALHRPLHLPTVDAGAPCPATVEHQVTADFGVALGDGPVYPVGPWEHGTYSIHGAGSEQGWFFLKVLWISRPEYTGPILIRGQRIDGSDGLRFSLDGTSVLPEMTLQAQSGGVNADGWSDWPSYTMPRVPGCYAYQVDGVNFSEVMVFRVVA